MEENIAVSRLAGDKVPSTTALFAFFIGISWIQGLTFLSAASCSISLMGTGESMREPVILSLFIIRGNCWIDGRPSSGAPT